MFDAAGDDRTQGIRDIMSAGLLADPKSQDSRQHALGHPCQ
ncbi:hypothetical protein [Herbaspirillum sp. LeCh32-8]|nr:hypothetical protein [Herbaspirillum sp. LeCh32-8]